jgi:hypothetical protein
MRIRSMVTIGLIAVVSAAGFVGSRPQPVRVPPRPAPTTPFRATIAIAPLDRALTFARSGEGSATRTIAVTRYRDGVVTGIDLTPLLRAG